MKTPGWLLLVAGTGLAGCGGAAHPAAGAPPAPAAKEPGAHDERQLQSPEDAPEMEESPEGGGLPGSTLEQPAREKRRRSNGRFAQPPPGDLPETTGADVWTLLEDFAVAESLTLSGQGGCQGACRALRSMMRSADRLCGLAETDQERRVCEQVRQRVQAARDHVRSSCGRCVHGPDLDDED